MIGWIAEQLGGLTRDTVNVISDTIEDITSVGDRFSEGYDEGLLTDVPKEETDTSSESAPTEEAEQSEQNTTKEAE